MNLSTSNFEAEAMKSTRKIYAKTVIALGLCMSISMGLIVLFLESAPDNDGILPRVIEARAALPQILQEPDELVMFYGSSMTRAAFSPRQFDQNLEASGKKVTSFNFGFGGLNPYFQDILSRRISEQFNESDRRLKLAMIEFNPFQTTKTRWGRARPVIDSFLSVLASREELVELASNDLTRGIRLFNIKYIRNNISAEIITSFYGRALFPQAPKQSYKDDEKTVAERKRLGKRLSEQFDKEFPDHVDAQWKYSWRGGGTIAEERSEETLAIFDQYYAVRHTDALMKNDRLNRILSADIEELNFEPLLVEHFINIVKNFQGIADNVEVMMLPKNSKWIHYTPAAKERLAKVVKQIEDATGVTIKNHQDLPKVTAEMYRDTTHLARYRGDIVYTNHLLQEFFDLL